MTEPVGRFSAVNAIGRGLEEAPVLRQGLGVTWLLAAVGAGGRVVVPITIQQAIDRGIVGHDPVRLGLVGAMGLVAVAGLLVAGFAQRLAVVRLGVRSERALYDLRARLIQHIHRLSLADHNEERRGALVARVTSDIETLAQFFQWGGLAWLLDGTLMLIVAAVMLAYDWMLALVAFAVALPLAFVLRAVQRHLVVAYDRVRERNSEMLSSISEVVSGAETIRAYRAGGHFESASQPDGEAARRCPDPHERDRRLPVPVGRGVLGADGQRRRRGRGVAGPGEWADGGRHDRLRVPHVPVPRADRRVHRGARPDADGGRRVCAGCSACSTSRPVHRRPPNRRRCRRDGSTSTSVT